MGFFKDRRIKNISNNIESLRAECRKEINAFNAIQGKGFLKDRRRDKHRRKANKLTEFLFYWEDKYLEETGTAYPPEEVEDYDYEED